MSKSVFISHAVTDRELVKHIVDLMEDGIGVPEGEIFCTSLDGYDIPIGENFVKAIKDGLQQPQVVILILTPAYLASQFCLSELGAAWVMSHKIFPILVPPLEYNDVSGVLLGTQVIKVKDDIKLNQLRETLATSIGFDLKTQTKWDTKRRSFASAIEPILPAENKVIPSIFKHLAHAYQFANSIPNDTGSTTPPTSNIRVEMKDILADGLLRIAQEQRLDRRTLLNIGDDGSLVALMKLITSKPRAGDASLIAEAAKTNVPVHADYKVLDAVKSVAHYGPSDEERRQLLAVLDQIKARLGPDHEHAVTDVRAKIQ